MVARLFLILTKMKQQVRKVYAWVASAVMMVTLMQAVPIEVFSQEPVKLDLRKGLEQEHGLARSANNEKWVRSITVYDDDGAVNIVITFGYDASGRVSSMTTQGEGNHFVFPENVTLYYEVSGNKLNLYGESADVPKILFYVCDLNDMGYITREEDLTPTEANEGVFTYEYDANGQTIHASYNDDSYGSFVWENGNVVSCEGIIRESYTYTNVVNKANINFNSLMRQTYLEDIWGFALCGYIGKKDVNLMETYGSTTKYTYEFDADGYVTIIHEKYHGKYDYKYVISYDGSPTPTPTPDPTPSNPTTSEELEELIDQAPEGTEDDPTEIFIPSGGITLDKPIDVDKHIRLNGGTLLRGEDNPYAMLRVRSGYSLELDDVTVDGNEVSQKDGSLVVYGKLKLKDGVKIKNCHRNEADAPSGAICVAQGGTLTMEGGVISGNVGAYGSAVYNEGTFVMTGGEISSNTGDIGAVTNNAGGQFFMSGGKIISNKATTACSGVFVIEGCVFKMTGGEISNNEGYALYTWADFYIGASANVSGLTILNNENRLRISSTLLNSLLIRHIYTPTLGMIVASGHDGYQLTELDLQKLTYNNGEYSMKLLNNDILLDDPSASGIEEVMGGAFHLSVSGNRVALAGLPTEGCLSIYDTSGRHVASYVADAEGRSSFSLASGIYLLDIQGETIKFVVR